MIKPKGTVTRSNLPQKAYAKITEPLIEIKAWCPDENAEKPPEQVHFVIQWPVPLQDLPPIVLRFKGPDTLGFFIEELIRYRRHVWKSCEKVTGEKEETVTWSQQDSEDGDTWQCSGCGWMTVWDEGTPEENGLKFCSHCGHPVKFERYVDTKEEWEE